MTQHVVEAPLTEITALSYMFGYAALPVKQDDGSVQDLTYHDLKGDFVPNEAFGEAMDMWLVDLDLFKEENRRSATVSDMKEFRYGASNQLALKIA